MTRSVFSSLSLLQLLPILSGCTPTLDDAALLRLCSASAPSWENYDEDVKAQIGATPIALWQGEPLKVERVAAGLEALVLVEGPWGDLAAQVPVLLRTPEGQVIRGLAGESRANLRVYFFPEVSMQMVPFPWVELRVPRRQHRLSISQRNDGVR